MGVPCQELEFGLGHGFIEQVASMLQEVSHMAH